MYQWDSQILTIHETLTLMNKNDSTVGVWNKECILTFFFFLKKSKNFFSCLTGLTGTSSSGTMTGPSRSVAISLKFTDLGVLG